MKTVVVGFLVLFCAVAFSAEKHYWGKKPAGAAGGSKAAAPVDYPPLRCSEEALKWAKELADIAQKSSGNQHGRRYTSIGGLMDTRRFISPDTVTFLADVANKEEGSSQLFPTDAGANVRLDGEIWKITESPWYTDQYPGGMEMQRRHLVLRQDPSGLLKNERPKVFEFALRDAFSGGRVNFEKLRGFAAEAKKNAEKEVTDPAKIKAYDLPKGESIGYIGLVPPGSDVIVDGIIRDVEQLPAYLNCPKHGFRFVGPKVGNPVVKVSSDPQEIIRRMVKEYARAGINTIYLNAAAHGNEEGIHFGRGNVLKPSELTALFDEFPDTKFVIDTVACHAGGLAKAMEEYKDPSGKRGRIVSFLQTKGTSLNQEGRIHGSGNPPKIVSSYYNIFRVGELEKADAPGFGQAHLAADVLAKDFIPSDAEAYVSTANGGIGTKSIR